MDSGETENGSVAAEYYRMASKYYRINVFITA